MPEKRLYEVTARGYAYASSEGEAMRLVCRDAHMAELSLDAWETSEVEPEWMDAHPYGAPADLTCAQILQAQREAKEAATPDPNQLTLEEVG